MPATADAKSTVNRSRGNTIAEGEMIPFIGYTPPHRGGKRGRQNLPQILYANVAKQMDALRPLLKFITEKQ
jgi:hypothetical protein